MFEIRWHGRGGQGAKTGLYAIAQRGRYNEEGKVEQNYEVGSNKKSNALTKGTTHLCQVVF